MRYHSKELKEDTTAEGYVGNSKSIDLKCCWDGRTLKSNVNTVHGNVVAGGDYCYYYYYYYYYYHY